LAECKRVEGEVAEDERQRQREPSGARPALREGGPDKREVHGSHDRDAEPVGPHPGREHVPLRGRRLAPSESEHGHAEEQVDDPKRTDGRPRRAEQRLGFPLGRFDRRGGLRRRGAQGGPCSPSTPNEAARTVPQT